jgi:hypothetical protein
MSNKQQFRFVIDAEYNKIEVYFVPCFNCISNELMVLAKLMITSLMARLKLFANFKFIS